MLKKLIKLSLPEQFKPSKVIKNAWFVEDFGIVRSVWLDKSSFHSDEKLPYLRASIDFISNYCEIPNFQNHIIEASVLKSEMSSMEGNMRELAYWNEDEQGEIAKTLNQVLLPWLDDFGKPEVFADFLERSMVVGKDGNDGEHEAAFGDVLMQKQYDSSRIRQLKLGFLASISERTGKYEKALDYLLQFQSFYESVGSPNLNDSEKQARQEVSDKINQDIQRFRDKIA